MAKASSTAAKAAPIAAPTSTADTRAKSTGDVYVGCKLPHGLKLQLCAAREERENVMGGGARTFQIFRRTPNVVRLKGVALEKGQRPNWLIVNGAAITKVPARFWQQWLEQNHSEENPNPLIVNGILFARDSMDAVRGESRDMRAVRSGFEPIDPNSFDAKGKPTDPRMKGIRTVKKDDNPDEDMGEEEA